VFATLALNRGDTYRYAVSYAGAGGLAQFIRPTYSVTRRRYASAGLPADFVQAMSDHVLAVSAQYCLADWSFGRLPRETRRTLAARDREEDLGAFIAAAYNGGEDRAASALAAHPSDWEREGNGLARQTVGYVREFRAVYRHLFP
jgi:hypothetical protein